MPTDSKPSGVESRLEQGKQEQLPPEDAEQGDGTRLSDPAGEGEAPSAVKEGGTSKTEQGGQPRADGEEPKEV